MAFSICKIKNISGEIKILNGKEFQIDEIYQIQDLHRIAWATNDAVLTAIGNELFQVYDAIGPIAGISNQIDWLKNY